MRQTTLVIVIVLALAQVGTAQVKKVVCREPGSATLAAQATSDDPDRAKAAIDSLRSRGPDGLAALCERNRELIARYTADPSLDRVDPQWRRLCCALDGVAGQRDAYASQLYWHTEIDSALAASRETGRPILSLRLLGKLTDELSCANSRFFRTSLYANAEVSQALRERFVLHWQTVRPVPKITIDFGDGRTMEGTVTGNSIHYILDSDGRVLDALPGLYGPKAFLRGLQSAEQLHTVLKSSPTENRTEILSSYHAAESRRIQSAWQQDLAQLGRVPATTATPVAYVTPSESRGLVQRTPPAAQQTRRAARPNANPIPAPQPVPQQTARAIPRAVAANAIAAPKSVIEAPVLAGVLAVNTLTAATDDAVWGEIARLHAADAQLDQGSVALMRAKNPAAAKAGARAVSKRFVEDPLVRVVRNFQNSIAIDTVRNEYTLHRQIHDWLAAPAPPINVAVLNDRVYAELFLTPSDDPWLGLRPVDTYTAIENSGVRAETSAGAGGR